VHAFVYHDSFLMNSDYFGAISLQLSSSPDEKTQVDSFNSSLASLISSGWLSFHCVHSGYIYDLYLCHDISR
jgi:hypothetical protein